MGKITRALATGVSKTYYKVDNEFVAVGTYFIDSEMYYTAAHPTYGLWLCGRNQENSPIPVGFVAWDNIDRIIIDDKTGLLFVVVRDYDTIVSNADVTFKTLYKKALSHKFASEAKSGEEIAIKLPIDLFGNNILPYLEQRYSFEHKEVKGAVSILSVIAPVLIIIIVILSIIL